MTLPTSGQPQDPNWTRVSASRRRGVLYLKLPRSKAHLLVVALQNANQDLLRKELEENSHSFCAYGPVEDWEEDLQTLESLPEPRTLSVAAVLQECIRAIKGGLRGDPQFDWIGRVGGPHHKAWQSNRPPGPDLGLELQE